MDSVCSFLANFLRPDALLWCLTHSSSCASGSRRRLTQRLFAGCPRRRTRNKSHGPYETLDRCALIRSAMAKVEPSTTSLTTGEPAERSHIEWFLEGISRSLDPILSLFDSNSRIIQLHFLLI